MTEFNSEMYLRQQTPDILGGIQSGMKIGEMKRQKQTAEKGEMFKKGLREAATTDANGNVTYDQKRLSALGGMFPQEVAEMQKQSKEAAFEQKKREQEALMKHQEYAAPIVLSMTEPQSYQLGIQKLKAAGNPLAQELPPDWDPKLMAAYHRQVTPVAQYFAMKKEKADYESKGFQQDANGNWVIAKGGTADLSNREKAAQIGKINAERDYIAAGKPGGRGLGGGGMVAGQGGGKLLPASQAESSGFANAASKALDDVSEMVTNNGSIMGPVQGRMSGMLGATQFGDAGENAATMDAILQQRAQVIGKYLEGGKLTDGDIIRYKKQLPMLSDSPRVAQAKVDSLRRLLAQKQSGELEALKQAGYATGRMQTSEQPVLPGKKSAPPPQDNYDQMSDAELAAELRGVNAKSR